MTSENEDCGVDEPGVTFYSQVHYDAYSEIACAAFTAGTQANSFSIISSISFIFVSACFYVSLLAPDI